MPLVAINMSPRAYLKQINELKARKFKAAAQESAKVIDSKGHSSHKRKASNAPLQPLGAWDRRPVDENGAQIFVSTASSSIHAHPSSSPTVQFRAERLISRSARPILSDHGDRQRDAGSPILRYVPTAITDADLKAARILLDLKQVSAEITAAEALLLLQRAPVHLSPSRGYGRSIDTLRSPGSGSVTPDLESSDDYYDEGSHPSGYAGYTTDTAGSYDGTDADATESLDGGFDTEEGDQSDEEEDGEECDEAQEYSFHDQE